MKRFWLILLSLGLIMAFSASAFAVDVKFSGDIDFAGVYLNKATVDSGFNGMSGRPWQLSSLNNSTAFYYERMRFGVDFVVSPCLKLVTQFDALDRVWGQRSGVSDGWPNNPGTAYIATPNTGGTAGTRAESENIAMNVAYVEYTSPIGLFKVGYQKDFVFGTVFGDRGNGMPSGQIQYFLPVGPVLLFAGLAKETDQSATAITGSGNAVSTDTDFDSYRIAAIYGLGKKIEVGTLLLWNRIALYKDIPTAYGPFLANSLNLVPYFKAQIGPVALQGELNYGFGKVKPENGITGYDQDIETLAAFLDATANLGMVYVGGSFAYVSGQDPNKTDTIQMGFGNTGGLDWNPCLIMFNTDLDYWAGDIYGHSGTVLDSEMQNAYFFQGRVGVKPMPKLDTMLSVSYATADKKSVLTGGGLNGYQATTGGTYGWEVDVTGTYKITNNLSYMLGFGYLFTGDYFKGITSSFAGGPTTSDDYIVVNKLTLSF